MLHPRIIITAFGDNECEYTNDSNAILIKQRHLQMTNNAGSEWHTHAHHRV